MIRPPSLHQTSTTFGNSAITKGHVNGRVPQSIPEVWVCTRVPGGKSGRRGQEVALLSLCWRPPVSLAVAPTVTDPALPLFAIFGRHPAPGSCQPNGAAGVRGVEPAGASARRWGLA